MPPTAGVYVSLVRHAPIPSLHGGAQWTLDKEVAQDQNTATAVQSTYAALGSLLSRNQISAVYTAPDPESVHTGTLILHDPPTYGRVTPVSSPLLLHTPLSSSSMQDLHEYQDLFQQIWQRLKAAPETQPDDLDVRAMAALAVLILPWLHTPSSQPLHVVLVTAGVLADRLLHCLFHLHGSNPSVLRPMSERPVSMPAAPLQPGAFHQVHLTLSHPEAGGDRLHVHVCALSESSHLLSTPHIVPMEIATPAASRPTASVFAPYAADTTNSPTALPPISMNSFTGSSPSKEVLQTRPESVRPSSLSSSPLRMRPVEGIMSFPGLHSNRDSLSRSSSATISSKNVQNYDMSTMFRSIEKWDPEAELPNAADLQESISSPLALSSRFQDLPTTLNSGKSPSILGFSAPSPYLRNETVFSATSSVANSIKNTYNNTSGSVSTLTLSNSPSTFSNVSAFAHSLLNHLPTNIPLNNNPSTSMVAPDPSSLWQALCVRILPIFYQDGRHAPIETLSDYMDIYIRLMYEKDPYHAYDTISTKARQLLSTGLSGLGLQLQQKEGVYLVLELVQVWKHYYGTVVPYLHAAMLPLETKLPVLDEVYTRAFERMNSRESTSAASLFTASESEPYCERTSQSSTPVFEPPTEATHPPSKHPSAHPPWALRRTLLLAFRDQIVLPICDWLHLVSMRIDHVHMETEISQETLRLYITQLFNILGSLNTDDYAQERIERCRRGLLSPSSMARTRSSSRNESMQGASANLSPVSPFPSYLTHSTPGSPMLGIHI